MDQVTMQLVMLGGFMAIAYFLLIKPQKKRQKAIMEMRENLKIGDMTSQLSFQRFMEFGYFGAHFSVTWSNAANAFFSSGA